MFEATWEKVQGGGGEFTTPLKMILNAVYREGNKGTIMAWGGEEGGEGGGEGRGGERAQVRCSF